MSKHSKKNDRRKAHKERIAKEKEGLSLQAAKKPAQEPGLQTDAPKTDPRSQPDLLAPAAAQTVAKSDAASSISTRDESNILSVKDLKVYFPIYGGVFYRRIGEVKAVDGVSFNVKQGEVLGLVGESGCGKSTVGKTIIHLLKSTVQGIQITGNVEFHSSKGNWVDLMPLSRGAMHKYRSEIQMIFQDPYSSLNPRLTVGQIVEEPLSIHCPEVSRSERKEKVVELLRKVGMGGEQYNRYPHEFSGGQRQRIGIARALATKPRLIVADEPVSALDVSIQAQVINLMQDLQEEFGLSYLFIAHDLSVVEHISDRIAVMYLGNLVELGKSEQIYNDPVHPYSKALLSAVPLPDPKLKSRKQNHVILKGEIPSPLKKPSGCGFRTRCPIAREDCAVNVPPLVEKQGRLVACPYA